MDDLITGEDDDQGAFTIYQKAKQIMSKGGFNLRKWRSNSRTLLQEIAKTEVSNEIPRRDSKSSSEIIVEDDESYAKSSTGLSDYTSDDDHLVKVLGIKSRQEKWHFTAKKTHEELTQKAVLSSIYRCSPSGKSNLFREFSGR